MIPVIDAVRNIDEEYKPYIRLWAAVFRQGIIDTVSEWQATKCFTSWWFDSEEYHPGSFVWLCELFEIDPDRARSTIRMKAREIWRNNETKIKSRLVLEV